VVGEKKADAGEHPEVYGRVGLLGIAPTAPGPESEPAGLRLI